MTFNMERIEAFLNFLLPLSGALFVWWFIGFFVATARKLRSQRPYEKVTASDWRDAMEDVIPGMMIKTSPGVFAAWLLGKHLEGPSVGKPPKRTRE
jgi:hypothetical protein